MFGYITPLKSELKMREFEYFRSYYHGLCYALKENFGNIQRLTLNYDMTFIGFLLEGLNATPLNLEKRRCIKHPTSEIVVVSKTDALNYVSNLSLLFFKYKLEDNIADDNSIKSRVYYLFINPSTKKIFKQYEEQSFKIKYYINEIIKLENSSDCNSIDQLCEPFSQCMGYILQHYPYEITEDSETVRNDLYTLGYNIGKYIYLIDAFDDLKDDMESNKFNPFNLIFNKEKDDYLTLLNNIIVDIEIYLLTAISSCNEIIKRLPLKKHSEILENITSLGMVNKYYEVLNKYTSIVKNNNNSN